MRPVLGCQRRHPGNQGARETGKSTEPEEVGTRRLAAVLPKPARLPSPELDPARSVRPAHCGLWYGTGRDPPGGGSSGHVKALISQLAGSSDLTGTQPRSAPGP